MKQFLDEAFTALQYLVLVVAVVLGVLSLITNPGGIEAVAYAAFALATLNAIQIDRLERRR